MEAGTAQLDAKIREAQAKNDYDSPPMWALPLAVLAMVQGRAGMP